MPLRHRPNFYVRPYHGYRHSASSSIRGGRPYRSRCSCYYGPFSNYVPRNIRDREFWRRRFPDIARRDEEEEREKKREEKERRLKEEELKKLKELKVEDLNLHIPTNAKEHHTNRFEGKDGQLVLRRGQEFILTVIFDRGYRKEQDDLTFILEADKKKPEALQEQFELDEDGTDTYRHDEDFGARIIESDSQKKALKLAVYIPGDCVVGEWEFKIITHFKDEEMNCVYEHPESIIILFNPWSEADLVHFTDDKTLLNEYVLNNSGSVYRGSGYYLSSSAWSYGQFEDGILDICLTILRLAFDFKITPVMADPIRVSRALSRIVNHNDDNGVLMGNWSGEYQGGTSPSKWKGSVAILRKYGKTKQPVKYGQCWVFSHVLTTVCRALGLPCRSVTNFDSAHDTNESCTIDLFYNEEDDRLRSDDSIWNFHVWNEVWILRPDLPKLENSCYDGWHVIDATPQEHSDGMFQCGPCPVEAVKQGHVNIGYDTSFVFSEVNADVVHWIRGNDLTLEKCVTVKKSEVGHLMSTKPPDGEPHNNDTDCWPSPRMDVTSNYKYEEGSEEERAAVERAVCFSPHGKRVFKRIYDHALEVSFDRETQTMVGTDLLVKAFVKNISKKERKVEILQSVRTSKYWNNPELDKILTKENLLEKSFKPGQVEQYTMTVPYDTYIKKCDESLTVFFNIRARDVLTEMPYRSQLPIEIRRPRLYVEGPKTAKNGETVEMKLSFTNPLPEPMTGCKIEIEGNLKLAESDSNGFKLDEDENLFADYRGVGPGETVVLKLRLVGRVKPDDDGRVRSMNVTFVSKEIEAGIEGSINLTINVP